MEKSLEIKKAFAVIELLSNNKSVVTGAALKMGIKGKDAKFSIYLSLQDILDNPCFKSQKIKEKVFKPWLFTYIKDCNEMKNYENFVAYLLKLAYTIGTINLETYITFVLSHLNNWYRKKYYNDRKLAEDFYERYALPTIKEQYSTLSSFVNIVDPYMHNDKRFGKYIEPTETINFRTRYRDNDESYVYPIKEYIPGYMVYRYWEYMYVGFETVIPSLLKEKG